MPDYEPLALRATSELIDELQRRFEASIICVENTTKDNEKVVTSYYNKGGSSRCLGMSERLKNSLLQQIAEQNEEYNG